MTFSLKHAAINNGSNITFRGQFFSYSRARGATYSWLLSQYTIITLKHYGSQEVWITWSHYVNASYSEIEIIQKLYFLERFSAPKSSKCQIPITIRRAILRWTNDVVKNCKLSKSRPLEPKLCTSRVFKRAEIHTSSIIEL